MIEINKIQKGHVLDILRMIDDESVDCITTSPPYYGLRAYKTEPQIWLNGKEVCIDHWFDDGEFCLVCNAWRGELGLEPTFELYLQHMFDIFDEIYRILKPEGTCFVNLGDTYNGSGQDSGKQNKEKAQAINNREVGIAPLKQTLAKNIKRKSLLQIPNRFAIGLIDRGWILRNEIIWHKQNTMPSSAKDRFTVDYEKIFFLTKNEKYFFNQMFEKLSDSVLNDYRYKNPELDTSERKKRDDVNSPQNGGGILQSNPLGRNMRAVWQINPAQFPDAHFAVYPEELVERMILAGCPEEICNKCGKPKEKIYDIEYKENNRGYVGNKFKKITDDKVMYSGRENDLRKDKITKLSGYTDCGCNAGYHPGIVLDPFIGSGTSAIVARKLNRNFIGIELQEKYFEMAEKRIFNELGLFQ